MDRRYIADTAAPGVGTRIPIVEIKIASADAEIGRCLLLLEPAGTLYTGNVRDPCTVEAPLWI